jgi:low affinity Fe/Cu permease
MRCALTGAVLLGQSAAGGERERDGEMSKLFARFANRTALLSGNYHTFIAALGIILLWALTGPIFSFSDTWQLVINTGTTIITFLMVFLIQNSQNRDSLAVHLKLDEIIKSIDAADNDLIRAEDETDEELQELKRKYEHLCVAHEELRTQLRDAGLPAGASVAPKSH